jgi:hypothetical protein
VNAPIRLSFAVLPILLLSLLLSGCAGVASESGTAPRTYRETLIVEQPALRSAEETTSALQRSHDRTRAGARDRGAAVTMGR